jgi:CBS-domain-containing membrane protein
METPRVAGAEQGLPATAHAAPRDISVHHVARLMKARGVTAVVVVDAMKPVGIVTDRDIVLRVTAPGLDATKITVGVIMTSPVKALTTGDRLDDALALMDRHAIRQLPIVDQSGHLTALLSLDDLLRLKRAGTVTFTGLLSESPPEVTAPIPGPPPAAKFSKISAPEGFARPAAVARPAVVVPMVKRRQWTRVRFSIQSWYHRNGKWMIFMLAVAIVGTGIALVVGSFYNYKPKHYEPKDSTRGEMIEKETIEKEMKDSKQP